MLMNYYYKITNMNICNGLKPIQSDADVQKMCNFAPKIQVIDIYIEELSAQEAFTKEQHFLASMECTGPSTVVTKELSDEKGLLAIEGP